MRRILLPVALFALGGTSRGGKIPRMSLQAKWTPASVASPRCDLRGLCAQLPAQTQSAQKVGTRTGLIVGTMIDVIGNAPMPDAIVTLAPRAACQAPTCRGKSGTTRTLQTLILPRCGLLLTEASAHFSRQL